MTPLVAGTAAPPKTLMTVSGMPSLSSSGSQTSPTARAVLDVVSWPGLGINWQLSCQLVGVDLLEASPKVLVVVSLDSPPPARSPRSGNGLIGHAVVVVVRIADVAHLVAVVVGLVEVLAMNWQLSSGWTTPPPVQKKPDPQGPEHMESGTPSLSSSGSQASPMPSWSLSAWSRWPRTGSRRPGPGSPPVSRMPSLSSSGSQSRRSCRRRCRPGRVGDELAVESSAERAAAGCRRRIAVDPEGRRSPCVEGHWKSGHVVVVVGVAGVAVPSLSLSAWFSFCANWQLSTWSHVDRLERPAKREDHGVGDAVVVVVGVADVAMCRRRCRPGWRWR